MKLLQDGENEVLRTVSKNVAKEQFGTKELKKTVSEMQQILSTQADGVALAAPQVGIPYRIFVVASNLSGVSTLAPLVYINPVIEKYSKEKIYMEEGCLSVRWLYGQVKRHTKVTIVAQDINGNIFRRGAGGLLAHIFQHECEHLDGVLFIDKAVNVGKLDEESIEKMKSKNIIK